MKIWINGDLMVFNLWQFNIIVSLWGLALLSGMTCACFWLGFYLEKERKDAATRKMVKTGWVWLGIFAWFLIIISISYLFFTWVPLGLWNLWLIFFFSLAITFWVFYLIKKNKLGPRGWAISLMVIGLIFFFFFVETAFVLSSPYSGLKH